MKPNEQDWLQPNIGHSMHCGDASFVKTSKDGASRGLGIMFFESFDWFRNKFMYVEKKIQ